MNNFDIRNNEILSKEGDAKRIFFMGTGPFALPILEVLIADKAQTEVVGAITKPDARIGRGGSKSRSLKVNPVKEAVLSHGIHLWQPTQLTEELREEILSLKPDLLVVVSYGKILPPSYLTIAPFGAINIHASLLPHYRGASPIQNSLLSGDKETGITIIQIDEGLDTGPMLAQAKIPIQDKDTTEKLTDVLSTLGANTTLQLLPDFFSGKMSPQEQDHDAATLCQMISREDGHISWLDNTRDIINRFRGLTPWPGIYSMWQNDHTALRIKLHEISPYTGSDDLTQIPSGTTFLASTGELCVRTLDSAIIVSLLQKEGKTAQDAETFLRGNAAFLGTQLL